MTDMFTFCSTKPGDTIFDRNYAAGVFGLRQIWTRSKAQSRTLTIVVAHGDGAMLYNDAAAMSESAERP
jgi:hypothetical protein